MAQPARSTRHNPEGVPTVHSLTEQDRESIIAAHDLLDWEIRQAKLRGNTALAFVYEDMLGTLRRNVCEGNASEDASAHAA